MAALVVEALAQADGRWVLVVPPPIPEKRALIKVYGAGSETEVWAAVDNLPDEEQALLVSKVYRILTLPTAAARTEAFHDALQDTSAPVARWRQVGAFDSAPSCERQRALALQSFEREASRVRSGHSEPEELSVEDWRLFERLAASRRSRCVPESAFLAR